jgi:hypothetical protein
MTNFRFRNLAPSFISTFQLALQSSPWGWIRRMKVTARYGSTAGGGKVILLPSGASPFKYDTCKPQTLKLPVCVPGRSAYISKCVHAVSHISSVLTPIRCIYTYIYIVTDLLKAFLGNGSVNTINAQQWKMCLRGRMFLCVVRQQRTSEDAGY